ncbi:MAG TPA: ABC transporter permease [Acetobacteraceae bacterium]|nr:ABC transporter permease [Acetobacteraceae bacterium]
MNLALRDVRRNKLRFTLTGLGVGMLLGVVIAMMGIYEGALADALRLPRAEKADLWVVQPRTFGPCAEPSRIPRDTRELIRCIRGWQRPAPSRSRPCRQWRAASRCGCGWRAMNAAGRAARPTWSPGMG